MMHIEHELTIRNTTGTYQIEVVHVEPGTNLRIKVWDEHGTWPPQRLLLSFSPEEADDLSEKLRRPQP